MNVVCVCTHVYVGGQEWVCSTHSSPPRSTEAQPLFPSLGWWTTDPPARGLWDPQGDHAGARTCPLIPAFYALLRGATSWSPHKGEVS